VQPRLFADVERTNGRPGLYSEDSFAFLDRAAGVVWERIREKLDEWYTSFPDVDGDLRERFRSPRPDQHYAAWWELYVHNLLQSMGFEVTVHPEVPGTTGHPLSASPKKPSSAPDRRDPSLAQVSSSDASAIPHKTDDLDTGGRISHPWTRLRALSCVNMVVVRVPLGRIEKAL
jgi:hypothetical protein